MRPVTDLAAWKERQELRALEREVLRWQDPQAQDLIATALSVLGGYDTSYDGLELYANGYRTSYPLSPAGAFAAATARLLFGDARGGIALLAQGFELSGDDTFWSRYARYAIRRSNLTAQEREEVASDLDEILAERNAR